MFDRMKKSMGGGDQNDNMGEPSLMEDTNVVHGERITTRGGTNIARTVAPTSVIFHEDYFKLNEVYERVLYLESWPTEVDPNWLRPLYQWHRAIDISVYYTPLPMKALLGKLRSKSARESSEIERDEQQGSSIDFARIQRLEDSLVLQERLQRGETKPFQVALIFAIRAESLKELNEITQAVEKQIDAINARTRRAGLRQRDGLLSVLPFGRNYLADGYSTRNMQTEGAQSSFPFANADLTHPSGIWYGINLSTNSNVILDRFQLTSPHSIVLGGTGSGKSYSVKLEIIRALMDDTPVMVIDPDAECERLVQYLGGQFITIGASSHDRINVMDFSHTADGIEDQLTPKISSVLKLVGAMMGEAGSSYGLNPEQIQILDQLLREVYMDFGYTQDPRTQVGAQRERMPVLSDYRARLERFIRESEHNPHAQEIISQVVASIGPYCTGGTYAALFDQHTNVNLTEDFVVFNIKPLTAAGDDKLLALGMHSVLEFVSNAVMNRQQALSGRKRLLFVDEAHVMMRSLESANFLAEMFRRARKYYVGITVITQDPSDFVRADRPQGRIIFANSSLHLFLNMKRQSLEQLQDMMGLDDNEVDLLSVAARGQGMLFAMNDRVWVSMDTASPTEHDMITTNPEEVAKLHQAAMAAEAHVYEPAALPAGDNEDYGAPPAAPRVSQLAQPDEVSQLGPPVTRPEVIRRTGGPKPLQNPPGPAAPQQPNQLPPNSHGNNRFGR